MSELKDLTCAWQEWHETCEIDKCSEQNIADLCKISDSTFSKAINSLPKGKYSLLQIPQSRSDNTPATRKYIQRYTFHLMESYFLSDKTKEERQQFKDEIFAGAKEPGMVTGYFLRAFFRSFVKLNENVSCDIPFQLLDNTYDDEQGKKKIDEQGEMNIDEQEEKKIDKQGKKKITKKYQLYPLFQESTSIDMVDDSEIEKRTQKYWQNLNEPERAALYTNLCNMTMSTPELLAKVGYGKSVFLSLPQKLIGKLYKELSQSIVNEDDRIEYLRSFLRLLPNCFEQWEQESELGQWICENFPYSENEKKRHFLENISGKSDS